jgi:hypothetical protein
MHESPRQIVDALLPRLQRMTARPPPAAGNRGDVGQQRTPIRDDERAAPVGVGARTSATKSQIVKSVSWPTPETTGIADCRPRARRAPR